MKNLTSHKVRSMFMLGGATAMMGATMMAPKVASADTAQNYKTGAAVLGILGVVLAVKGKTLPAVVAGAGAYYAYEKGNDAQNDECYNDQYNNRYNGYYGNDNNRYGNSYNNGNNGYHQNDNHNNRSNDRSHSVR